MLKLAEAALKLVATLWVVFSTVKTLCVWLGVGAEEETFALPEGWTLRTAFMEGNAFQNFSYLENLAGLAHALSEPRFLFSLNFSPGALCALVFVTIKLARTTRMQTRRATGEVYRKSPFPYSDEDFKRVGIKPLSADSSGILHRPHEEVSYQSDLL